MTEIKQIVSQGLGVMGAKELWLGCNQPEQLETRMTFEDKD